MQNTAIPADTILTPANHDNWIARAQILLSSTWLPWMIMIAGVALRLREYLFNRSLWLDEAALALNLLNRSFSGLLQPLEYNQAAPPVFLFLEKLNLIIFGKSDLALRIVPLVTGIAAIYVFYRVSQRILISAAVPLALLFFVLSQQLIIYASELKPYSSDVFAVLLTLWLALEILDKPGSITRLALFGVVGSLLIWSSYPVLFILAGIGFSILITRLLHKEFHRAAWLILPAGIWMAAFIALYIFQLHATRNNSILQQYWDTQFLQFPTSLSIAKADFWLVSSLINDLIRVGQPALVGFVLFAGAMALWLRNRVVGTALITPFIFLAVASMLHDYPVGARLMLFSLPIIFILISEGATQIRVAPGKYSWLIGLVLAGFLLTQPLIEARRLALFPTVKEEIKQPLAFIRENWQPGDKIYIYDGAVLAFLYYSSNYGFTQPDYIIGINRQPALDMYAKDLQRLRGMHRVWILFSHVWTTQGVNEQDYYLSVLDGMGKRLQEIQAPGAAAFLYEFSPGS